MDGLNPPLSPNLRAELLGILTGEALKRRPICHGYQNCCWCPTCTKRRKPGECRCLLKRPDRSGYCEVCRRAVPGFFEAEREAA